MVYSSHHFSLKLALIITIGCSILFIALPEIDLLFASLFFEGENNFLLRNSLIHSFMDAWVRPSIKYLVIILAALTALSILSNGQYIGWSIRNIIFIALTFSLGPGLIVNGVLKEFIGRARPKNIIEFGGDKIFSPAYFPSDQCAHNCSFVSGDASVGFSLLVFYFITKKNIFCYFALFSGIILGFIRIIAGGHFFSDIIFSQIVVTTSIFASFVLYKKLYDK